MNKNSRKIMFSRVFAHLLKKREAEGVSKTEICKALGITKSRLSQMSHRENDYPSMDLFMRTLAYFDVSADYLLFGEMAWRRAVAHILANKLINRTAERMPLLSEMLTSITEQKLEALDRELTQLIAAEVSAGTSPSSEVDRSDVSPVAEDYALEQSGHAKHISDICVSSARRPKTNIASVKGAVISTQKSQSNNPQRAKRSQERRNYKIHLASLKEDATDKGKNSENHSVIESVEEVTYILVDSDEGPRQRRSSNPTSVRNRSNASNPSHVTPHASPR